MIINIWFPVIGLEIFSCIKWLQYTIRKSTTAMSDHTHDGMSECEQWTSCCMCGNLCACTCVNEHACSMRVSWAVGLTLYHWFKEHKTQNSTENHRKWETVSDHYFCTTEQLCTATIPTLWISNVERLFALTSSLIPL